MLLIAFLCLIAKITLVSGECDVGTQNVQDFDFNKVARTWYALMHTPNGIENNIDCAIAAYAPFEGNRSLVTLEMYNIRERSHTTIYGNVTNWSSAGYWDLAFEPANMWSGRFYVIAVDYDRYVIFKHCTTESNKPNVYVGYRSQQPEEETVEEVLIKLQENNIDVSQLVYLATDHCQ